MPKPPVSTVYGRAAREPPPLRLKEYPRDKASFTERDGGNVTAIETKVKTNVTSSETRHRARPHDPVGAGLVPARPCPRPGAGTSRRAGGHKGRPYGACLVAAQTQDKYPSKPIKIIVPYVPGGATDIVAHYRRCCCPHR